MNVEIINCTDNPIEVISVAAGTCYGKSNNSFKRVVNCYSSNHMSVFEHASVTFLIDGISRACSHQLVRHRLASYSQQSQRYCRIDTSKTDWYVKPESLDDMFDDAMARCASDYQAALERGVKPEDARYLLPEAAKTKIAVTMNCRELFYFLDLRCSKSAQWEIRELANAMEKALRETRGWCELMFIRGDGRNESD